MTKLEPTRTYSNLTATERLRAMLDERGVEHYDHENGEPLRDLSEAGPDPATSWRMGDASVCAVPNNRGTFDIWIDHATPEQAIAATLGAGTCKADETDVIKCWVKCKDEPSTEHMELIHVMECSSCGGTYEHVNGSYEFCPRCGRKVVGK